MGKVHETLSSPDNNPYPCGEDAMWATICLIKLEQPPQVWGRPEQERRKPMALGTTPTPVGNTPITYAMSVMQNNPHVCGEDCGTSRTLPGHDEQPPRPWGRLFNFSVVAQYH